MKPIPSGRIEHVTRYVTEKSNASSPDSDEQGFSYALTPPFQPRHTLSKRAVMLNNQYAPPGCANYYCGNPSGFLDSPFCDDCIWRLWAHIDATQPEESKRLARLGRINDIHREAAERGARAEEHERLTRQAEHDGLMTEPGTIYYLRVGDLIKIGYTIDIDQRMRQYPPNVTLLATHPGTRETERQMHHKFLHRLTKGREWFSPCDEIDRHVQDVLTQFGDAAA